jgi:hypothetical protein
LEALLHLWPDGDWDREMRADAEPGGKLHDKMSASRKDAAAGRLRDFPSRGQTGRRA